MESDTAVAEKSAEHDEIIHAMRQMSTEGKPVRMGDEISTGDLGAQMIVGKIVEPGVVTMYDTLTGQTSVTSRHMLAMQLQKTRPDGSRVFSLQPPRDAQGAVIAPKRGQMKCMLHPDNPSRKIYDSWGLVVCTKDNLPSSAEVKKHMKGRHPLAWATIEEDRLERKEQLREERDARNAEATMAALAASATGQDACNAAHARSGGTPDSPGRRVS